jgi:hypothetical protein
MAQTIGQTRVSEWDVVSNEQVITDAELILSALSKEVRTGSPNKKKIQRLGSLYDEVYAEAERRGGEVAAKLNAQQQFGVRMDEVDTRTGLPAALRSTLSFAPTPDDKAELLKEITQSGEVEMVPSGGSQQMYFRSPEFNEGRWTLVDEYGVTPADIAEGIGEVPKTIAGILGGSVGYNFGGPIGAATLATATETLAGIAQDALYRSRKSFAPPSMGVSGVAPSPVTMPRFQQTPEDIGSREIVSRRLGEAPMLFAADLGAGWLAKGAGRLIGGGRASTPSDTSALTRRIDEAYRSIDERFGVELDKTPGMRSGARKADVESVLASGAPDSAIAVRLAGIRDSIEGFRQTLAGGSPITYEQSFRRLQSRALSEDRILQDNIREAGTRAKALVGEAVKNRLRNLSYQLDFEPAKAGQAVQASLSRNHDEGWVAVRKAYQPVHQMAKDLDIQFDGNVVAKRLKKIIDDAQPDERGMLASELMTPEMKQAGRIASKLEKPTDVDILEAFVRGDRRPERINISWETINNWRSKIGKSIDWNDTSIKQKDKKAIYAMLDDLVDKATQNQPKAFRVAADRAKQTYRDRVLPYRQPNIAGIIKQGPDGYVTHGRKVLPKLLELEEIDRVEKLFGPESQPMQAIRNSYIHKLMADATNTADGSINVAKLTDSKLDRELVKRLYGERGAKMVYEINKLSEIKGIADDGFKLAPQEVRELLGAKTPADIARIARQQRRLITERHSRERARRNEIWKLLTDETLPLSDAGKVVDGFFSEMATPAKIRKVMSMADKDSVAAIRKEYFRRLMDRVDLGDVKSVRTSQKTGEEYLWSTDKLRDALKVGSKSRNQIEAVLGKDDAKMLDDLNVLLKAASPAGGQQVPLFTMRPVVRNSGARAGMSLYLVDLPRSIKTHLLASLYGQKALTRFFSQTKEADKWGRRAVKVLMGTEGGVRSLAEEASEDPRFEQWLHDIASDGQE